MGLLVSGQWHTDWYDTKSHNGKFVREQSQFRKWITADGAPGPHGQESFPAEPNRYHLYVSLACPWAHRALILRELKGLQTLISVDVVHPHMLDHGWELKNASGLSSDSLMGHHYLYEIYTQARQDYSGRVTVPVLWDKHTNTIVNNESSEIIRIFNNAFDHLTGNTLDFYPQALRAEIDAINQKIYTQINNGVYKCGFATTQMAYEDAYHNLFQAIEWLEKHLEHSEFLLDVLTEADWRLFTTLIRFDVVYFSHFKCNKAMLKDFKNITEYLNRLYHIPGIANTVNFEHIKQHYYYSHKQINPTQIVPLGPTLLFDNDSK